MGLFDGIKNVFSKHPEGTQEIEVEKELDTTSVPLVQAESGGSAEGQQINQITSYLDGSEVYELEGPGPTGPGGAVEAADGPDPEPLAVELENVQITSYQLGVLDNDAATDGNDAATDDMSMTLNFEKMDADGATSKLGELDAIMDNLNDDLRDTLDAHVATPQAPGDAPSTDASDELSADDTATMFNKSSGKVEFEWKVEEGEAVEEEPGLTTDDDAEGGGTGVGRVGGKMHLEDVSMDEEPIGPNDLTTEEPDGASSGDAGEQVYLQVELENVQIDPQQGAADEVVAAPGGPQAASPKMLEVFQKGEAKDASEDDGPSTLVPAEDGGSGEMVKMGSDPEMNLADLAEEPELEELEDA
jgi:hypothetical protein